MNILTPGMDLKGKWVLVRTDFDVPVVDGRIQANHRIIRQKEVLDMLVSAGARVVLVAHISAVDSFKSILVTLEETLGHALTLLPTLADREAFQKNGQGVGLLENVRTWRGETENSEDLAKALAQGMDAYVQNAFAVCHRAHASVDAVAKLLPPYAGPLVVAETNALTEALDAPAAGKVVIIGGAKASTKVPVISHVLSRAEAVLVGGVVANDLAKARGIDVGTSLVDDNIGELLAGLDVHDERIILSPDFIITDGRALDIGPQSVALFKEHITRARMIVWNGPLGLFEDERYAEGTFAIARAVADSPARTIIGGGDTVAAIDRLGIRDRFSFVSTGGGAMLAFLAGQKLPGLEAIGYYEHV